MAYCAAPKICQYTVTLWNFFEMIPCQFHLRDKKNGEFVLCDFKTQVLVHLV